MALDGVAPDAVLHSGLTVAAAPAAETVEITDLSATVLPSATISPPDLPLLHSVFRI